MIDILETYFSRILDEIHAWLKLRKNLLQTTGKVLLVFGLAFTSAFPGYTFHKIFEVLSWKNGFISFAIVYALIIFIFYPLYRNRNNEDEILEDVILFFGVPLKQVVSYIFKNGTFKLEEVAREFQVSRAVVHKMMEVIDPLPIFVRGKNNARVLDITLTEDDIIKIINPNKEIETTETDEDSGIQENDETNI